MVFIEAMVLGSGALFATFVGITAHEIYRYSHGLVQQKSLKRAINGKDTGFISSLADSKDQLLSDLEIFVKRSEKTVFPYKPVFSEWAPAYNNEVYSDYDFLEMLDSAAGKNNRKFNFIIDDDKVSAIENKSHSRIKDLPTLANEGLVNLILKNKDLKYKFTYQHEVKPFLFMGQDEVSFPIGHIYKLFRTYNADRNNNIVYFEQPGIMSRSEIEKPIPDSIRYRRVIWTFDHRRQSFAECFDLLMPRGYLDCSTFHASK